MALYNIAILSAQAATGATLATIHTGATNQARIREIALFMPSAANCAVGIARASNTPVATTSVLALPLDTTDPAATVNIDSAWSTAPTVGNFLRRLAYPNVLAAGGFLFRWYQDDGLVIPVSSWLVIWGITMGISSSANIHVEYEEGA